MLTPEDIQGFRPDFEAIHFHLTVCLCLDTELNKGLSEDEVAGHAIEAMRLMEILVAEVHEKQGGHSIQDILDRAKKIVGDKTAAGTGALAGAIAALKVTGLGGFGVVAGGSAAGVAGVTGAAVATGGAALAGGAALFLAYRGGARALRTDAGKAFKKGAGDAGKAIKNRTGRLLSGLGDKLSDDD